jgi:hypothetical protein
MNGILNSTKREKREHKKKKKNFGIPLPDNAFLRVHFSVTSNTFVNAVLGKTTTHRRAESFLKTFLDSFDAAVV